MFETAGRTDRETFSTTPSSPDAMLAALDGQVSCYRRLAKLSGQQHEFVQHGQVEELLGLLTARQSELDQLAVLERTLAPAKKSWAAFLAGLPQATRQRAADAMAETKSLLERITAADKNDVLVLQQRKLALGRQLGQATTGRTVNRAYAVAAYGAQPSQLNVQT